MLDGDIPSEERSNLLRIEYTVHDILEKSFQRAHGELVVGIRTDREKEQDDPGQQR